ncbi:MAG TPA: PAS domain S-box protein [Burkholderiaceae bacterium]|nr:PAS domain S-box protein [Burkholderiaceae bacterium]
MPKPSTSLVVPYMVALAAVLVATAIRVVIDSFIGHSLPFLAFFGAIVAAGWAGGLRPALAAMSLSALVHLLLLTRHEPPHQFNHVELFKLMAFFGIGSWIAFMCEAMHSAFREAALREREARHEAAERREAEMRYRLVLRAAQDALWDWDIERERIFWNEGARALLGYDEEPAGYPVEWWSSRIHPDDRDRVIRSLRRTMAHGPDRWQEEYRFQRADGRYAEVQDRGWLMRDENGRAQRMLGAMTDLTESHRANASLRESEERFRSFFTQTAAGIVQTDLAGRLIRVNRRFCDILERSEDSLLRLRIQDITHPGDLDASNARVASLMREESESSFLEIRYLRADGEPLWADVGISAIRDAQGHVRSIVCIVLDASERRRAEAALRESEERYRVLTEVSPQVVWMADPQGRVVYVNRIWLEYSGLTMERTLGTGWRDVVHPDHRDRMAKAWADTMASESDWSIEVPLLRAHDGQYRWHQVRGLPTHDRHGNIVHWIGTIVDVHEAREAARRKDEFIATLAHELRNPLAPVRNALELIRRKPEDVEVVEQARSMMERQMETMVRLIDDLLDVSRITRGVLELKRRIVRLTDVVASAVETSTPVVEQLGHRVSTGLVDESWYVDADPTRLAQALCNLLHNAAKYTPVGGTIELSVQRRDDSVEIKVKDSGIGIAPDMLERVFDMFSQVHDTSIGRTTGGLGIGLTLVRRLVDMHGGRVIARSEGLGRGSEFIVSLPLMTHASMLSTLGMPNHVYPAKLGPRKRVLIADDNVDAVESLAAILSLMGHEVRVAYDGREALAIADAFRPEVAVLDIGMPYLNGYDTAHSLRERPWATNMLLIALTGWGQRDDQERSARAGFKHHLVKPVEPARLDALISPAS